MDWQRTDTAHASVKIGEKITLVGFPVHRRRWWQFWKPREWSVNGTYVVTDSVTVE